MVDKIMKMEKSSRKSGVQSIRDAIPDSGAECGFLDDLQKFPAGGFVRISPSRLGEMEISPSRLGETGLGEFLQAGLEKLEQNRE